MVLSYWRIYLIEIIPGTKSVVFRLYYLISKNPHTNAVWARFSKKYEKKITFRKLYRFTCLVQSFNSISIEFIPLASPYRTESYRTVPNRTILYVTIFKKIILSHFSSLLNTISRAVTLNVSFLRIIRLRKIYRYTYRYRFYQ